MLRPNVSQCLYRPALCALYSVASVACAQQSQEGEAAAIVAETTVAAPVIVSARAVDGEDALAFAPTIAFASPAENPDMLLRMPGIKEELELISEQEEQLRRVSREMQKGMQSYARSLSQGGNRPSPEQLREMRSKMEELRKQAREKVQEVLLPHQRERLGQLGRRMQMQMAGTANALASEELAEALGISDEQRQRLQQKARQVQQRVQRQIQEIRRQAREEILSELTPTQREKLNQLLGDEMQAETPFGRIHINP